MGDPGPDPCMSGLLERVPVARHRSLLRSATVVTALLFIMITALGLPLRTGAAPLGIVSLQFAASPEAAERMLASWASVPRGRLLWAHGLDLLLPVAYALAIGLAATRAAQAARTARRPAAIASGAAVAAAIADQVENVAMGATILLGPAWTGVLVTLVAATVKSTLLVLSLGALVTAIRGARAARVAER